MIYQRHMLFNSDLQNVPKIVTENHVGKDARVAKTCIECVYGEHAPGYCERPGKDICGTGKDDGVEKVPFFVKNI